MFIRFLSAVHVNDKTYPILTYPILTVVHVHHFLYLRYCWAIDIFQNFCWPVAIWAVIHLKSKSETAQKQFLLHIQHMFLIFDQLSLFGQLVENMLISWHFCVKRFFAVCTCTLTSWTNPDQTVKKSRQDVKSLKKSWQIDQNINSSAESWHL
jgi:hypothetical protein